MKIFRCLSTMLVLALLVTACTSFSNDGTSGSSSPTARGTADASPLTCPFDIQVAIQDDSNCQTPHSLRVAYGVESLTQRGYTGTGQTIVDIVSYGDPSLQQNMNTFDSEFGLPSITLQVMSPIGSFPFDRHNKEMTGWADETNLDVQTIHAIAPGANIVVLTSPVDETEGTIGLPQFLELEQYAVSHHLGSIISQSFGASEVTLKDSIGQQEIQQWDAFYQQATTQQGITFFGSSGDNGATDYTDLSQRQLSTTPTTSFPPDDPWVTATGGTALQRTQTGGGFSETAWNDAGGASGGGFSAFFSTPSYQRSLPSSVQHMMQNRRGVPDVAVDADPNTGLAIYNQGWELGGGTSAAAPFWAALAAIANQMAGHALGFLNPALYKLASSSNYTRDFRDITQGNNSVKVHDTLVPGYNAVPGWDPVTCLGSPDAEHLLPDLIVAMSAA